MASAGEAAPLVLVTGVTGYAFGKRTERCGKNTNEPSMIAAI
jgi:hypothetical protein